jgi:F-type H+-transporting ATPase subunit a
MSATGHGINFVEDLAASVGLADLEPLFSATIVAGGVMMLSVAASRQLALTKNEIERLTPPTSFGARAVFEGIVEFVIKMNDMVLGPKNRSYVPFCGSLFIFILFMNLFGLIPGFSAPTDSIPINAGLALTAFVMYHVAGVKGVGLLHYVAHFFGPKFPGKPLFWVVPFILVFRVFMFAIEIISHSVRPLTLTLRLFGNMFADHAVLTAFMGLAGEYLIPVIFYCFGAFVSLMQASVFTLLTMVYIKLAIGEEGSHDH